MAEQCVSNRESPHVSIAARLRGRWCRQVIRSVVRHLYIGNGILYQKFRKLQFAVQQRTSAYANCKLLNLQERLSIYRFSTVQYNPIQISPERRNMYVPVLHIQLSAGCRLTLFHDVGKNMVMEPGSLQHDEAAAHEDKNNNPDHHGRPAEELFPIHDSTSESLA